MNIGVFIPNWIGDTVMCTPALRALKRLCGPEGRLVGVLRPYVVDVLAGTAWLDEQLLFDRKSPDARQRVGAVTAALGQRRLDATVLLTNSFRSGAMAWWSRSPRRVGYVRYGRGPLLTHKLYPPRLGRQWLPAPAIESYLQLAYALGCELESPKLELATLDADEQQADAVWNKWNLPPGERVVVLNSGGAFGSAKEWPREHFSLLARRLAVEQDLAVLVTCGPAERDLARRIAQGSGHPRVVSLADERPSIGLTKACIRRSRLLISTDSGPRFFGIAFGVPVVSLFGPTDPVWTRTLGGAEICLQHNVPCGPCGRRTCPLGHHECMRLLGANRVYAAALSLLNRAPAVQAA